MRSASGTGSPRPWIWAWSVAWVSFVGVEIVAAVLPGKTPLWTSPFALFVIVVVAASLCAVASGTVLVIALLDNTAELGLIGAFALTVSMLPLVHGLTVPSVLYGTNTATMSSVFWALPVAAMVLVPLIAPKRDWSRALMRHWRPIVAAHVTVTFALTAGLLVDTSLLPVPALSSPTAVLGACGALLVCWLLSVRQLRLSWISRSRPSLAVSLGFAFVGASNLVWLARAPFTTGFWLAHAFDTAGVFLVSIGAAIAYRQRPALREILRPLTINDPLSAFELGLEPLVHRFVALLETKDPVTRDHVVRTADLAISLGEQLGLPAQELGTLGLGALLHDIGKLAIPDAVLNKPGRLTEEEFTLMRSHVTVGASLAERSTVLAPIAPIVRWHHERVDGRGYPDGLTGEQIPLLARIVSACDAFDAMSNTRQYREGMGTQKAVAILTEHAGSQWDQRVIEALTKLIAERPTVQHTLDRVGRPGALSEEEWCGCADALPNEVLADVSQPNMTTPPIFIAVAVSDQKQSWLTCQPSERVALGPVPRISAHFPRRRSLHCQRLSPVRNEFTAVRTCRTLRDATTPLTPTTRAASAGAPPNVRPR